MVRQKIFCNGEVNTISNINKIVSVYINKNNLILEYSIPKAIKDDNSQIDETKNNGYTHLQTNTEINS